MKKKILAVILSTVMTASCFNVLGAGAENENIQNSKQNGDTYVITDYIDGWGCSLADIIEEEFDMPIEEYIAENYAELASINAIPTDLRSDTYVS